MAAFISRHPALAYFVLTFAVSWGGVLLVVGGSGGMSGPSPTSDPRFACALLAMLAGPSIAGILLTAIVYGGAGVHEFFIRARMWRVAGRWYAVALLTAPVVWTGTLLVFSIASPQFIPRVLTADDKAAVVLVGILVGMLAGFFEELGWTGFAVPQLRRRHGVLATGILVGVPWGAWHLLTNVLWTSPTTAGEVPLAVFIPLSMLGSVVGYLVAFRVLMVWVYDRTGSVFATMLMHASLTASVLILEPQVSGWTLLTSSFGLAVVVWAAVATIAPREFRVVDHEPQGTIGRAA